MTLRALCFRRFEGAGTAGALRCLELDHEVHAGFITDQSGSMASAAVPDSEDKG
jgi:hypothetical protein